MRLIDGLLLGAAYVLPPGPILLKTMRRSALGGVRAGLAVQLGAMGGRMLLVLTALSGSHLLGAPGVRQGLGIVGAAVLLWLGAAAIWRNRQPTRELVNTGTPKRSGRHHAGMCSPAVVGVVLAVANPYGFAVAVTLSSTSGPATTPVLVGYFLGSLGASVGLVLLVGRVCGRRSTEPVRWLAVGAGCVLIGCGVQLLRSALT